MNWRSKAIIVLYGYTIIICLLMNYQTVQGHTKYWALSHKNNENTKVEASFEVLAPIHAQARRNISIVGDQFMVDGESLHIISGSLHYFRLPAAYWRDRLRKLKAAGLNAVSTYVEWSYHEPEERQYSFEGDRDIVKFLQMAAEEGLYVLLRPGPYICAERDLGGFPYWLLSKHPKIQLRSTEKDYINETKIWMKKLFGHVEPLLYGNGGPIILVQVENEYGSYGSDKSYKEQLRDILLEYVGTSALLYTTDGEGNQNGRVDKALYTIDFGPGGNITTIAHDLRIALNGTGPLMNSEYYTGWLTHWGDSQMAHTDTTYVVETLRDMLDYKMNINFYMFYGGTNFDFTAGANHEYSIFQPDVTSYDYDSPITEAGDLTSKYYAIRDTLKKYFPKNKDTPVPPPSPKGAYGKVSLKTCLHLLSPEGRKKLGKKYSDVTGDALPTFEHLRQRAGLMLYETTMKDTADALLEIKEPRDRVYVFLDGNSQGMINRMIKTNSLNVIFMKLELIEKLESVDHDNRFKNEIQKIKGAVGRMLKDNNTLNLESKDGSIVSLLVENQGRINYGDPTHLHDFKGILGTIEYNKKVLNGTWSITGYPLQNMDTSCSCSFEDTHTTTNDGPVLYSGNFSLPAGQKPLETFLNPSGWGKGFVWINGHNLGRYWPAKGPQITLYVPGVWLRAAPAQNTVMILELEQAPTNLLVEFIDHPVVKNLRSNISHNVGLNRANTFVKQYSFVNRLKLNIATF